MDLFSANQLMWAAFIVGNSAPVIFFILYYYQKITAELFKLYFLGVLVGLTWEIPFALAGKSFHLILIDWPINLPLVRNITYSFIDGLIFIVGIFLAKAFLKNKEFLYTFNSTALLIMIIWGSISEFFCSADLGVCGTCNGPLTLSGCMLHCEMHVSSAHVALFSSP